MATKKPTVAEARASTNDHAQQWNSAVGSSGTNSYGQAWSVGASSVNVGGSVFQRASILDRYGSRTASGAFTGDLVQFIRTVIAEHK